MTHAPWEVTVPRASFFVHTANPTQCVCLPCSSQILPEPTSTGRSVSFKGAGGHREEETKAGWTEKLLWLLSAFEKSNAGPQKPKPGRSATPAWGQEAACGGRSQKSSAAVSSKCVRRTTPAPAVTKEEGTTQTFPDTQNLREGRWSVIEAQKRRITDHEEKCAGRWMLAGKDSCGDVYDLN